MGENQNRLQIKLTNDVDSCLRHVANESGVAIGVIIEQALRSDKRIKAAAKLLNITFADRAGRGRPKIVRDETE